MEREIYWKWNKRVGKERVMMIVLSERSVFYFQSNYQIQLVSRCHINNKSLEQNIEENYGSIVVYLRET